MSRNISSEEYATFRPEADGNPLSDTVVEEQKSAPGEGYSRLAATSCFRWVNAGRPNHINLNNTCDQQRMATVRHAGHAQDLKYRLPRRRARLIETFGINSVIIGDDAWDFYYGTNVANRVDVRSQVIGGQRLWTLHNLTRYYVCYRAGVAMNGVQLGYSEDMIEPNSELRVWAGMLADAPYAWLVSAHADPL